MTHLAKPDGTLLTDHVQHLNEQADQLLSVRENFLRRKYEALTGADITKRLRSSIRWHDEGKKDDRWQIPCQKDYAKYNPIAKKTSGIHLLKAGIRHELASLEFLHQAGKKLSMPVWTAIAAHHGKLSRREKKRWLEHDEFEKFWIEFIRLGKPVETLEEAIRKRYEFAGPRSLLQLVDHRASASEADKKLPAFASFSYQFPYTEKRGVQKIIEDLRDEPYGPLIILRAPTGAGKTDAALLWAQHQIEAGRADRLVIAMPTRFTANALSISVAENLSAKGLYHSTSRFKSLEEEDTRSYDQKDFDDKEQELARLLETPVTVTTLDHLCICLTGTREDHHSIFFNMAHSCVVIDEADFYDDFTQQNMIILLQVLSLLQVPALLMSATVPESAKKLYTIPGHAAPRIHEDKTDEDRPRCALTRYGKATGPDDLAPLLHRAVNGAPTIIYANTVRRAQAYRQWFMDQNEDFAHENVVLYHSRFTEPHKVKKEKQLYDMLGSKTWDEDNQTAYGVAILTQIGELSVNISADFMISDLCPIDRMAQRVGRLARFHKKGGELFVVDPHYINKAGAILPYPAPYGHFQKGGGEYGWEETEALRKSSEMLCNGIYSARSFMELVNELYGTLPDEILPHIRENREALMNCILGNWLILPAEETRDDDDHTNNWQCRDIPFQFTVYADYTPSSFADDSLSFRNKSELREFMLRYGIHCYAYEFHSAVESGCLKSHVVAVGDEEETLWFALPQFYTFDAGLRFD